jgi:hypothetical protein
MKQRRYPTWDECHCNFKAQKLIFLVYHSRHEQRGETVVSHEWGIPLSDPPAWLRRILHYSAQASAILNPTRRYVERLMITPQKAQQFALTPQTTSVGEESTQAQTRKDAFIIWRREVLHVPRHALDAYTRRLFPVEVLSRQSEQLPSLPVLWDPASKLPLPLEGGLLDAPTGTRFDCIGWTPAQVSYCTVRLPMIAGTASEK